MNTTFGFSKYEETGMPPIEKLPADERLWTLTSEEFEAAVKDFSLEKLQAARESFKKALADLEEGVRFAGEPIPRDLELKEQYEEKIAVIDARIGILEAAQDKKEAA